MSSSVEPHPVPLVRLPQSSTTTMASPVAAIRNLASPRIMMSSPPPKLTVDDLKLDIRTKAGNAKSKSGLMLSECKSGFYIMFPDAKNLVKRKDPLDVLVETGKWNRLLLLETRGEEVVARMTTNEFCQFGKTCFLSRNDYNFRNIQLPVIYSSKPNKTTHWVRPSYNDQDIAKYPSPQDRLRNGRKRTTRTTGETDVDRLRELYKESDEQNQELSRKKQRSSGIPLNSQGILDMTAFQPKPKLIASVTKLIHKYKLVDFQTPHPELFDANPEKDELFFGMSDMVWPEGISSSTVSTRIANAIHQIQTAMSSQKDLVYNSEFPDEMEELPQISMLSYHNRILSPELAVLVTSVRIATSLQMSIISDGNKFVEYDPNLSEYKDSDEHEQMFKLFVSMSGMFNLLRLSMDDMYLFRKVFFDNLQMQVEVQED